MTSVMIDRTLKPGLILDSWIDLTGPNTYGGASFLIQAQGDDATWGNPVPIDAYIESQLRDGAVMFTQGHDNRDLFVRVKIKADDATGLQAGEAALFSACGKRTTLEWTPPDGFASTSVFKVFTAHLEHAFDGDEERIRTRTYGIRLTAYPWVQSVDPITLTATPDGVSFSETVIDECTATTNWTAAGTLTLVSSQAVRSSIVYGPGRPAGPATNWLLRTASVTISDTYLRVKGSSSTGDPLQVVIDGVTYDPIAVAGNQWWFEVPAGTYPSIKVQSTAPFAPSGTTWTLTVWSLYETNTAGFGTNKELQRAFTDIKGTAPAPGSTLTISHPTNGLGDVLAYVYPAGLASYSPPLQPYRTTGGSITADSGTVSGGREPINGTPTTWVVEQAALPPGGYHFLARIRHTSAAGTYSLTYTAEVAGTTITQTVKVTLDATNTWQTVTLDTVHLPPLRLLPTADEDITITLAGPANIQLDTAWLFLANEIDTPTALIQAAAGTELSLTFQAADVDYPTDVVYLGSHAAGPDLQAADAPVIKPDRVNLYLVTADTEDAEAELLYYPHWHTHASL